MNVLGTGPCSRKHKPKKGGKEQLRNKASSKRGDQRHGTNKKSIQEQNTWVIQWGEGDSEPG